MSFRVTHIVFWDTELLEHVAGTTEHIHHQEILLFIEKIALRRGGEPLLEKRPEDEISIVSSMAICK